MIWLVLRALAANEIRLRMRRTSTLVALLAVVALSWAMIPDPAGGTALLVFGQTRVLYTSSALALGTSALGAILFGLGGFYLARGRMSEDIRSGTGAVIGATPVSGTLFLAGRWLGGVGYLAALVLAFMLTVLALHALRGDGPIEVAVYLATYAIILLPMIAFAVSCAILFDSVAPLMGKGGDILFFVLWALQLGMIAQVFKGNDAAAVMFDFSGLSTTVLALKGHVLASGLSIGNGAAKDDDFAIGASGFNAALAPIILPAMLWSARIGMLRAASFALALLPLLPAVWLFHRFSPDKVKLGRARQRRSPLAWLNSLLRPLSVLVRPLLALAARLPGVAGQVTGDLALTLLMAPAALLALLCAMVAGIAVDGAMLPAVLMGAVAAWGIAVSDISTRDYAAAVEDLTGAVAGGGARRYLRHYGATLLLGFLFTGAVALRWSLTRPLLAAALVAGVCALGALASLFGRCSRSARLFLGLFLFALYVALNARHFPMLDAVGFNGVATAQSVTMYAALALTALLGGYAWNRRG